MTPSKKHRAPKHNPSVSLPRVYYSNRNRWARSNKTARIKDVLFDDEMEGIYDVAFDRSVARDYVDNTLPRFSDRSASHGHDFNDA